MLRELIEMLTLLNKKPKSIPVFLIIFFLFIIAVISAITGYMVQNKGADLNGLQNNVKSEAHLKSIKASQPIDSTQAPAPKAIGSASGNSAKLAKSHQQPPVTAEENKENIYNFTKFHDFLIEELRNIGYDESFARNLSFQIGQNLQQGKTSLDYLYQTIHTELGDGTSKEEVQKVKEAVVHAVVKISSPSLSQSQSQ